MDIYKNERNRMSKAKSAANSGSMSKQYLYASYCEYLGKYSEAFKYYKMAADQGCTNAYYDLGLMYKLGKGIEQDYNIAFDCFKNTLLDRISHSEYAILNENIAFLNNVSVTINDLEKEAKNGIIEAIYLLGIAHEYAKGTNQNLSYAFDCYKAAADKDHTLAQYRLGAWYDEWTYIPYSSENKKIAREYYTNAANKGYIHAAYALGWSYHLNDDVISLHYFKAAADAGIAIACRMVAVKYEDIYRNTGDCGGLAFDYYLKGADLSEVTCLLSVIRGYHAKNDTEKAKIYQEKFDGLKRV